MLTLNQKIKQSKTFQLLGYRAHHKMQFEHSRFHIKIAENAKELRWACKLRYKVFYQELQQRRKLIKLDVDEYDRQCDHILVIDKKTNKCVGTYRLNLIDDAQQKVYTEHEFDMKPVLALPGKKLELGRACINPEFRSGAVFMLIWKAIVTYANEVGASYMFGCSSVQTTDFIDAGLCHWWLHNKYSGGHDLVAPKPEYKMPSFDKLSRFISESALDKESEAAELVPPLLKFYLKSGAQICGEPALDQDFKCIDFFTLVKCENLSDGLKRRGRS